MRGLEGCKVAGRSNFSNSSGKRARFWDPMTTPLAAVLGLGLLLGFRHAFEPDHLAAVSTLATRSTGAGLGAAARLGAAWAAGHTASVGFAVALIMAFGVHLPASLQPVADFLVALLLIGLGGSVLARYARGR